jgi:hypothetical protein
MKKEVKDLKTSLERDEGVPEKIKVIKSPTPEGVEKLPAPGSVGLVTVSIMLPSGIVITNPEQFEDDETENTESYPEDSTAST